MSRLSVVSAVAALSALFALGACKDDSKGTPTPGAPPNGATSASAVKPPPPNGGAIPTPEQFCAHIDELSKKQMAGANIPPDEFAKMVEEGHASCVKASTEDAKLYPEWGPCARCSMAIDDLAKMEATCDVECKTLGEKLDQKAKAQAPH